MHATWHACKHLRVLGIVIVVVFTLKTVPISLPSTSKCPYHSTLDAVGSRGHRLTYPTKGILFEKKRWIRSFSKANITNRGASPLILFWPPYNARVFRAGFSPARPNAK